MTKKIRPRRFGGIGDQYTMDPNQTQDFFGNTPDPFGNQQSAQIQLDPSNNMSSIENIGASGASGLKGGGFNAMGLIQPALGMIDNAIENNQPTPEGSQGRYVQNYMDNKYNGANVDSGGMLGAAAMGAGMANPLLGLGIGAASIGGNAINNLARNNDEYGVAQNGDFAVGYGAAVSPQEWISGAVDNFKNGNIGRGLLSLNPIGSAVNAVKKNEELGELRDKGKNRYSREQMFNKNYNNLNSAQYQNSLTGNTFQLENGGSMGGGNIRKEFSGNKFQQPINNMTAYYGPSHADGGIPVGDNTEVEGGEFKVGSYIFSDKLNYE